MHLKNIIDCSSKLRRNNKINIIKFNTAVGNSLSIHFICIHPEIVHNYSCVSLAHKLHEGINTDNLIYRINLLIIQHNI